MVFSKKGLNSIVASVLLVLVAIFAVVLMWNVINIFKMSDFDTEVYLNQLLNKSDTIPGVTGYQLFEWDCFWFDTNYDGLVDSMDGVVFDGCLRGNSDKCSRF